MTRSHQRHFLPTTTSLISSFVIREETLRGIKGPGDILPLAGGRSYWQAIVTKNYKKKKGFENGNKHMSHSKCVSAKFPIILIA